MKFNPINSTLYTNDGKLIKKMYCPYISITWNDLSYLEGSLDKYCAICKNNVIETKGKSDIELLELLQNSPEACLKIDFNQDNMRISTHV